MRDIDPSKATVIDRLLWKIFKGRCQCSSQTGYRHYLWISSQGDILINELQVSILASCAYCTSYELRVILIAQVTSYFLHASYESLFIARVTSYYLLHEIQGTAYCTSYELLFAYELWVDFYVRVTSYFLTMSDNKYKNDKAV